MKKDAYVPPCHIIVRGNIDEGFEFTGPFKNFDAAVSYDDRANGGGSWISTLRAPKRIRNKRRTT